MSDATATLLVGAAMILGLAGTVLPLMPGLLLIWAAALAYGLLAGFGTVGIAVMVVLSLVVVTSGVKSVLLPQRMADGHGVRVRSQLVALVGAVLGLVFIPVVGIVVGALAALYLAETVQGKGGADAWRSTVAVAKGFGLSVVIDVGLAMVMIGAWSLWALTVLV